MRAVSELERVYLEGSRAWGSIIRTPEALLQKHIGGLQNKAGNLNDKIYL